MADYIERQAAIAILDRWLSVNGYSEGEINVMRCMKFELEDMPTADVVEVVRCKDCVYRDNWRLVKYIKQSYCTLHDRVVQKKAFCAWGERKDG